MRCFRTRNLLLSKKCVPLHCVFHSIRFKVNKGWSTAVLLFLCLYLISSILKYSFHSYLIYMVIKMYICNTKSICQAMKLHIDSATSVDFSTIRYCGKALCLYSN